MRVEQGWGLSGLGLGSGCEVVSGGGYLELWLAEAGVAVAEEGDEGGAQRVLLVVVLGAVGVGQLDQAVVVRQARVEVPQTPRAGPTVRRGGERKRGAQGFPQKMCKLVVGWGLPSDRGGGGGGGVGWGGGGGGGGGGEGRGWGVGGGWGGREGGWVERQGGGYERQGGG